MLFFKKRFLLILHELTNTGAPRAVLNLCKTLISLGVDVWVISLKDGPLLDEFKNTGVKTFCLNYKKIKKYSFLFYFFDVVICNTICCYKLVDWFLKIHINIYWWLHEASYFSENIIQDNKKCINALKKCKHIFCVSEYSKEFFEKYNKNIKILGITIDDEFDNYKKIKQTKKISLLYCGELHPIKGQKEFLDYFLALDKNIIDRYEVNFIGRFADESYYKVLKEKTEECPNIKFLGAKSHDEVLQLMANCDFFSLFSLGDSFSIATLEANMMNKPVIISNNVGLKDYIIKEKVGYVVSTKSEFGDVFVNEKYKEIFFPRKMFINNFSKAVYKNRIKEIFNL